MNDNIDNNDNIENNENKNVFISPTQIQKQFFNQIQNQNISDVVDNLACEEVRRLTKTLKYIDIVEENLMLNIIERIQSGELDILTAQKVLLTLNKSAERSNNIIKDKSSSLIQILVDAKNQEIINNVTINEKSSIMDEIPVNSRKKLTKIFDVLFSNVEQNKESLEDNEVKIDERNTTDNTNDTHETK